MLCSCNGMATCAEEGLKAQMSKSVSFKQEHSSYDKCILVIDQTAKFVVELLTKRTPQKELVVHGKGK